MVTAGAITIPTDTRVKVTKFSSSDENFPRRKFSLVKIFPDETFAPTNILPGE